MALEPYTQQIGVTAGRGVINPSVPSVIDISGTFTQGAQSLLASQEPRLREEAEEQAIQDAGEANIVRDENGHFVRPEPPPGGGTHYVQIFQRVMRERYASMVTSDFTAELDRIATDPENFMNPEAFIAAAQGQAEGILEAVSPDVRGHVETVVAREISERFRGIAHRRASNDRQAMVQGLADTMRANDATGLEILRLGGADAERRAQAFFDTAAGARRDLVTIGELNAASVQAGELRLTMTAAEAGRYGTSLDNSRAITARLGTLSTPELQTIEMWAAGVATDPSDTVLGFNFTSFQAAVQEPEMARRVGVIAGGIANERLAEERRQAAIEREEAQRAEDRAALTRAIQQGFDGNYTYDERQQRALDNAFLTAMGAEPTTTVDQYMGTPEGRQRAVAFAAETGYLPTTVRDFIETRIYSAGAPAIAELAQNLRNVVTREGVQQGYRLYQTLSPKTRAAIGLVETLRRGGEGEQVIRARVDSFLRERAPTHTEIRARFVNGQGQNIYSTVRDAHIRQVLRMGEGQRIPSPITNDFDELLRWNVDIFDGDLTRAAQETARQVGGGWAQSPVFLGGVGPRHFVTTSITIGQLDEAFLRGRRAVPAQASFSPNAQVRARLETLDIGPQAGLGRYRVHIVNRNGQEIGAYDVDADARLGAALRTNREATARAQVEAARAEQARRDAAARRAQTTSVRRGRDY